MSCQQRVTIIEVHETSIRVHPLDSSLCSQCSAVGRCRMNWLNNPSGERGFEIPLNAPISLTVGDTVTVDLDDHALTSQLVLRYGLALIGLIGGLWSGDAFGMGQGLSFLCGCTGALLGGFVGHRIAGEITVRITQ